MTKGSSNKASIVLPSDAGCFVDGHWGHYASARLILLAVDLGWKDKEAEKAAMFYFEKGDTVANSEYVYDAADDAEQWMNDTVAPEGFSFGWFDSEFFLWPNEDWEEDYG